MANFQTGGYPVPTPGYASYRFRTPPQRPWSAKVGAYYSPRYLEYEMDRYEERETPTRPKYEPYYYSPRALEDGTARREELKTPPLSEDYPYHSSRALEHRRARHREHQDNSSQSYRTVPPLEEVEDDQAPIPPLHARRGEEWKSAWFCTTISKDETAGRAYVEQQVLSVTLGVLRPGLNPDAHDDAHVSGPPGNWLYQEPRPGWSHRSATDESGRASPEQPRDRYQANDLRVPDLSTMVAPRSGHMKKRYIDEKMPGTDVLIIRRQAKVLAHCHIVFSGVVPLGIDANNHDAALRAKSLGATVSEGIAKNTTHVIASPDRKTAKVRMAAKNPRIAIVSQYWLDACFYQLDSVDVQQYRIHSDVLMSETIYNTSPPDDQSTVTSRPPNNNGLIPDMDRNDEDSVTMPTVGEPVT